MVGTPSKTSCNSDSEDSGLYTIPLALSKKPSPVSDKGCLILENLKTAFSASFLNSSIFFSFSIRGSASFRGRPASPLLSAIEI